MMNKVIVIGGGAAGMMAAITAAEQGAAVKLLEPNERLGKKLNITGKGRCNVTNDCSVEELLAAIPQNGKFLYSAFSRFNSQDTMAFFEDLRVPLKTERGNRVFPVSDRSFDISGALEKRLRQLKVELIRKAASAVETDGEKVTAVRCADGTTYPADACIIATGGVSYPATGSTGDGYRMAAELGHTVVEPRGSLVPLVEKGTWCRKMQGLSLRNVNLTVFENGKKKFSEFGEMLFTHFGVTGPLVLSASAHMRYFGKKEYRLEIDLKPALDEGQLDKRLLADFEKYTNSDFCNALGDLLPQKMIAVVVERSGIDAHTKVHEITREERRNLLQLLKHFSIDIHCARPVDEAIITSGGIKVGEIQPATMMSKKVSGLYFAGEVMDVDAYTGGFNL
ncbi:MAG: NAD(P)/FAD-dependent oxidoreductase, partial [Oscillospiraceae bacterium]|nr:NAD(P)/FAD-dependent oxidoreductase [Oscillospiraceae bacterium]